MCSISFLYVQEKNETKNLVAVDIFEIITACSE